MFVIKFYIRMIQGMNKPTVHDLCNELIEGCNKAIENIEEQHKTLIKIQDLLNAAIEKDKIKKKGEG